MKGDQLHEREEVLEGLRILAKDSYEAATRMTKDLAKTSVVDNPKAFTEQRQRSNLAFVQMIEYLRAKGWYGVVPESDEESAELMQREIMNGPSKVETAAGE